MIMRFANSGIAAGVQDLGLRQAAQPSQRRAVCLHPTSAKVGVVREYRDREWRSGSPPRARFKRGKVITTMKRFGTALAVALVALCVTAGCNDYGNTFQVNTGALVTSLSPGLVAAGGPDLTLTVIGAGFVPKTVVQWDGKTIATTVTLDVNNNVTNLTAVVPAALTATPGQHAVNTLNPATNKQDNGLSNTITFVVTVPPNKVPVLTSISPASAAPGSADVTLTLTGSNFVQASAQGCSTTNGSVVEWTAGSTVTCLVTTFGSATQLTATVPANLLATESCASVMVFTGPAVDPKNPSGNGGGGSSATQTFTVSTNSAFCPAPAQAGTNAFAAAEETPAVSLDGRFVAFAGTPATGTSGGSASSAHTQILLRDTCEGAASDCKATTTMLSAAADGTGGNADSHSPSITADGRFVAFSSAATNLVSETPGGEQIFLRDTCQGAPSGCTPKTELISVDPNGLLSATDNLLPSISSSGRFIAFLSVKSATTKVPAGAAANSMNNGMNNGVRQVFVRDTCLGAPSGCTPKTTRISAQPGDANVVGGKPAGPAMSGNGSGVGIADNHSATLFTRSVAVDDRVFLAITKAQ